MADKTTELERVYTIPLRKTKDLVRSRRADLAVRDVKRYLSKHMKSQSIWLDNTVNEALWSNGKYSIPSRIRVRATRFSDGVVEVTLPESTATGSIREVLAERGGEAAEAPVLKAPEGAEDEHGHGPNASRPATDVKGVGPATAEKLEMAEIRTLHDLMHAEATTIANAAGVPAEKAQTWIDDAKAIVEGDVGAADAKSQGELEGGEPKAQPELEADLKEAAAELGDEEESEGRGGAKSEPKGKEPRPGKGEQSAEKGGDKPKPKGDKPAKKE
jgi:large subunit ribosomal protein L31e